MGAAGIGVDVRYGCCQVCKMFQNVIRYTRHGCVNPFCPLSK